MNLFLIQDEWKKHNNSSKLSSTDLFLENDSKFEQFGVTHMLI